VRIGYQAWADRRPSCLVLAGRRLFFLPLHGEPAELYFAWRQAPQKRKIAPYFYQATVQEIVEKQVGESLERRKKVSFTTIH
jgi:hypothetical protein